jgi:hypothetical protein
MPPVDFEEPKAGGGEGDFFWYSSKQGEQYKH